MFAKLWQYLKKPRDKSELQSLSLEVQKNTSKEIFSIQNSKQFEKIALEIFRQQAEDCKVYRTFVENLGIKAGGVKDIKDIPFLPIEFFKSHDITTGKGESEEIFTSSGTSGMTQSRHLVLDIGMYVQSFRKAFDQFYGDITKYSVLALLPSYLEREGSSLIYMVDDFIRSTANNQSGYFLYDHKRLYDQLEELKSLKKPAMLIGVTYALLDFAESHSLDFPELIVMETGGMKGKRREMVRTELHDILTTGFGVPLIHSEYGMTELLSQAYSKGGGMFHCPSWMKILIRDTNDPLEILGHNKTGGINVIDLANINSCCFIATQDLGKTSKDGTFEVQGRFDISDIRGCNLLVQT